MVKTLTKDQIQGVIDYFNSQCQTGLIQGASSSGSTITTLHGMAFSYSKLEFVGMLKANGNVLSSESWIIDTGSTHHVCHDRNLFSSLSETLYNSVTLPIGKAE